MSSPLRAPRAILFDLDNTLTARLPTVERHAERFARDFADALAPESVLEEIRRVFVEADQGGYNPKRALEIRERLRWRQAPSAAAIEEHWQARLVESSVLRDGFHELMEALRERGIAMGIVTNGGVRAQNGKIDHLGLREQAKAVVVSEAVGCKKPDPRIFEIALREIGEPADEVWFVGDHPSNDVIGARALGMEGIWIEDGHAWPIGEPEPRPGFTVRTLREVLELVERAGARSGA